MSEQSPDADNELTALSTVLNRVRPTVVVRRRVYEVAKEQLAEAPAALTHVAPADDDDDDGPPSSVNVARALAALRGDELRRLEEILTADEADPEQDTPTTETPIVEPPVDAAAEAKPSSGRTVQVGETITVPELARRMGVATHDLVTTLVAGGYFSTTAKSVLTRANATTAAWMFGWAVEPVDEEPKPAKKSGATKKKR